MGLLKLPVPTQISTAVYPAVNLLTIIADEYILTVFGLWLGYSILGMKIVTVDKCIGNTHMQLVPQELLMF